MCCSRREEGGGRSRTHEWFLRGGDTELSPDKELPCGRGRYRGHMSKERSRAIAVLGEGQLSMDQEYGVPAAKAASKTQISKSQATWKSLNFICRELSTTERFLSRNLNG